MASREADIVAGYCSAGEDIRAALSAYTITGFGRRVVGVTTQRLLLVRSRYTSIHDKGLLWADPIDDVALDDKYTKFRTDGVYTGNAYLGVRRADGRKLTLNPRAHFFGDRPSAEKNIALLYSLIPHRF